MSSATGSNQNGNQGRTQGGTDMNTQGQNSSQVSPERQHDNFLPQIPRVHRNQDGVRANVVGQDGTRPNAVGNAGQNRAGVNAGQNGAGAGATNAGQNGAGAGANAGQNGAGAGANAGQNGAGANAVDHNAVDPNGQNRARANPRENGARANVLNQNEQNRDRPNDANDPHLRRPNVHNNVLNRNQERYDQINNGNINNRPLNRQRIIEYEPYDQHVAAGPLFAGRHNPIRLQDLQREDAIEQDLDFKYLDLQIMRIIIPTNKEPARFYHGRRNSNQTAITFTRLFLMRVVTDTIREDHMKVAYVMEARNMNQNLFQNVLQYRDNGAITVGSVLRYASPQPITTYMRNDIPMLNSNTSAVVLRAPRSFLPIPTRGIIEANKTEAFVINRAQLDVFTTTPVSTTCRGKLCDKQRVSDWNDIKNKGCGCYQTHANGSSMAIMHAVRVTNARTEQTYSDNQFSSTNFTNLYMTGSIPPSASSTVLDNAHHEQGIRLIDCMKGCVQYINNNGGFTVIGWYKRGLIDDKSLISLNNGENEQVQSGVISHHIVSSMPSERGFLERRSRLHTTLTTRKFNVNNMIGA